MSNPKILRLRELAANPELLTRSIADVETSGGKNLNHTRNADGLLPAGALGVKANMLYDLYTKDPEFRQYVQNNIPNASNVIKQFPGMLDKDPISDLVKANPDLGKQATIAEFRRNQDKFAGDPVMALLAHNRGAAGAAKYAEDNDPEQADYVQKVREAALNRISNPVENWTKANNSVPYSPEYFKALQARMLAPKPAIELSDADKATLERALATSPSSDSEDQSLTPKVPRQR